MHKLFEDQLKSTVPLTQEVYDKLRNKTYFNNEHKQLGDVVLLAILMGDVIENETCLSEIPLSVIALNEKHFHLFEYDERHNQNISMIPVIKLKKI